ncbi:MAG: hypothetical protein O7G83_11590 [Proteobacteria bacterium]|nr:hypothetical protein [Pseudomonadota bacterium]
MLVLSRQPTDTNTFHLLAPTLAGGIALDALGGFIAAVKVRTGACKGQAVVALPGIRAQIAF